MNLRRAQNQTALAWLDVPDHALVVEVLGRRERGRPLSCPGRDEISTRRAFRPGRGSFTTFSTYSADTVLLWEAGERVLAVANAVGSVVVVVFVGLGLVLGRSLTSLAV